MENDLSYKLFLVVLGGRSKKSHIEIHDVRWVIGKEIKETFEQLRNQWIGEERGLHLDSYLQIKYVDGYLINLKKRNKNISMSVTKENQNILWFVNIGGYNPRNLLEEHEFGLIVANSAKLAKKKAKEKFLRKTNLKHNDDIFSISKDIDNCHSIRRIKDWEIELIQDKHQRSQLFIPDWYGYMRIDKR